MKWFSSSSAQDLSRLQKELDNLVEASKPLHPSLTETVIEKGCGRQMQVHVGVLKSFISYKLSLQTSDSKAIEAFKVLDRSCQGFVRKEDFVATVKIVLPAINPQVAVDAFKGLAGEHAKFIGYQRWLELFCQHLYHEI